jgi:hypothetical protein
VLAIFAGGLVGVAIVALVVVILSSGKPKPCDPRTCPTPPHLTPIILGTECPISLGVGCEYDSHTWTPTSDQAGSFELQSSDMVLTVSVFSSSTQDPQGAVGSAVAHASKDTPGLAPDCVKIPGVVAGCPNPDHELLGPEIGYVNGVGGMWSGNAPDTGQPVSVLIMASSKGGLTTSVTVVASFPWANFWAEEGSWGELLDADSLVNSVTWSGSE